MNISTGRLPLAVFDVFDSFKDTISWIRLGRPPGRTADCIHSGKEGVMRKLMIGYEAMVEGAVVGGCRAICGQRDTPPEEIFKAAGVWMPRVGGKVYQPDSELAAIENVYNLASRGARVLF